MLLFNGIQDFTINPQELEEPFSLLEGVYLAWTPRFVKEQISDRMMSAMGGLDYLTLTDGSHPVLFSQSKDKSPDEPLRVLAVWHYYIHQFLFCLCLIKDNSVNADVGFVHSLDSQGKEVASSNSRASVYTCADGCRGPNKSNEVCVEGMRSKGASKCATVCIRDRVTPSAL